MLVRLPVRTLNTIKKMRKGKEVDACSSETDDSEYAKRFRVAPSRKIRDATSDDEAPASKRKAVPSLQITGATSEAPASKVDVEKRGKGKAVSGGATSSKAKSSREAKRLLIRGSNEWISVGNFVRLRCGQSMSVVKITKIERDPCPEMKHKIHVRWCYKPEETKAGRQPFHGENELLVSDRETVEEWTSVVGSCKVLAPEVYISKRGPGTYLSRFEYKTESGDCYKIHYYCVDCGGRHNAGPVTLQQQLTGEAPEFRCPNIRERS